jgi:hypothetical protein
MIKKLTFFLAFSAFFIEAQAQVSTIYGTGKSGFTNSGTPSSSAIFTNPYQAVYNSAGNQFWVSDAGNNYIIVITGGKYYLRSGDYNGGFQDGGSIGVGGGLMSIPKGLAMGKKDTLFIVDENNHSIRRLTPFANASLSQVLATVSGGGPKSKGMFGVSGYANGPGASALFKAPVGMVYVTDAAGDYLVIADQGNNVIRRVSLGKDYGNTTLIAGVANDSGFYKDGAAATAGFMSPEGVFVDAGTNDIYVAEAEGGIRKISGGTVSTVVHHGHVNGPTSVIKKNSILYIADGCRIMQFDLTKSESATNPSLVAGDVHDTACSYNDGANSLALFNGIGAMTLSPDGTYLIVADQGSNRIRKVIPGGTGVGVEDLFPQKDMFTVYPNPAFGHVMVKSENSGKAAISLYSIDGKQVLSRNVVLNADMPLDISLENQAGGIYLLQVSTADGVYSSRIVVQ